MEINTYEGLLNKTPGQRDVFRFLRELEEEGTLAEAHLYYEFPLYREDNELTKSHILVTAKNIGVLSIGVCEAATNIDHSVSVIADQLERLYGQLSSKFIKNKALRRKRAIVFTIENLVYAPEAKAQADSDDFLLLDNERAFKESVRGLASDEPLSNEQYSELLASLEGSKGLFRPREKTSEELPEDSRVPYIHEIEDGIARFDRDQKLGYIMPLEGPQRVRGLAGSGKTVILAMKAALTHLREPEATICFTFHTKSLYQHIKQLVSRFYRHFDDRDPDWEKLNILHAWGGQSYPGVYYKACMAHSVRPMTLTDAKRANPGNPFGHACRSLTDSTRILPIYDYIFVDEAQDYDENFLYLCLLLAKKNRVIWGADELQNIFQTKSISYKKIVDSQTPNNPLSAHQLTRDWVLKTCYRTPREVLVCAHAMGFGFYGKIAQLLENREHWEDLGYTVERASYDDEANLKFQLGTEISIYRPKENSPKFVGYDFSIDDVVHSDSFDTVSKEVAALTESLSHCIKHEKVAPSDIMVVCADDRNVSSYFSMISEQLSARGISTNDTHKDSYGVRDFFEEGRVTLSTIHKAKGNEAYVVYVIGVDAIFFNPSARDRNRIFTAMTRTKGWLSISGVGEAAQSFCTELAKAKKNYPYFNFRLPTDPQLKQLKRDISIGLNPKISQQLDALQGELELDDLASVLKNKLVEIEKKMTEKKKF